VLNPPVSSPGPTELFDSFTVHYTSMPTRQGVLETVYLLFGWALTLLKAVKLAWDDDVAVIREQGPYLAGLVAVLAQWLSPVLAIVSLHNDYDTQQAVEDRYELLDSEWLSESVERFTISKASHVIVFTSYLQTYAECQGTDPWSVTVSSSSWVENSVA
jgi:hypothetical protein